MTEKYKIDTVSIILSEMLKESREQNITKGDFHKLPNKYAERIVKLFSIPDVINRRELLVAFKRWVIGNQRYLIDGDISIVDDFLSNQ